MSGLSLRVSARGKKTWTVLYRHRGRLRRLTLGGADVISLAKARERARDELHKASKGEDPATEKQEDKKAETIDDLAREYIERHAKRTKHTRGRKTIAFCARRFCLSGSIAPFRIFDGGMCASSSNRSPSGRPSWPIARSRACARCSPSPSTAS